MNCWAPASWPAQGSLVNRIDALEHLTRHEQATVRTDACHFLALTGSPDARAILQRCTDDPDAEVREVATEGLESLPLD